MQSQESEKLEPEVSEITTEPTPSAQLPTESSQNETLVPIFPAQPKGLSQINGRLLTPVEGCGFSPMANTRIVGGGTARNGIDQV